MMGHKLFSGTTESGKTTLARHLARQVPHEEDIIIRDPRVTTGTAGGDWPEHASVYSDDDEFFDRISWQIRRGKPAHVIVDEAADIFDLQNKQNAWMLRQGRHFGLYFSLIAQRPKMLAPNVRTQCTEYYIFRLAKSDVKELLADCGHEVSVLSDSENNYKPLDKGEFLYLTSNGSKCQRYSLAKILPSWRTT